MTPGDSNGEGGEARPFRAESITWGNGCGGGFVHSPLSE